ncbi:hypothetical protein F2P81_004424 [Scophthalmus maximus]|uniref:Uncharacterized protein n=1 Tax=Scophthalmus maximus TaxID=52904 RepID=A0A6A4T9M4_SCOMX|nr:hypothetical protein F2P81_004424 [Scophthalmus maximus]
MCILNIKRSGRKIKLTPGNVFEVEAVKNRLHYGIWDTFEQEQEHTGFATGGTSLSQTVTRGLTDSGIDPQNEKAKYPESLHADARRPTH